MEEYIYTLVQEYGLRIARIETHSNNPRYFLVETFAKNNDEHILEGFDVTNQILSKVNIATIQQYIKDKKTIKMSYDSRLTPMIQYFND